MVLTSETRKCVILMLDDQTLDIPLQPKLLASELLDIVASHFKLREKEYFGLCYNDTKKNCCWLRMEKKALDHDFPKVTPIQLFFCVKNYIPSITSLKENTTIELFYLQVQRLVYQGDLECDSDTIFHLAAYVLQATHGDYVSDCIATNDLKTQNVVPVKTLQEHPTLSYCEEQIIKKYQKLEEMSRGEAIVNYMAIVEKLPMYGNHYYDVKDKDQLPWKLGLSYRGVSVYNYNYQLARKIYYWNHMENLFYKDKKFSLEYREVIKANSSSSLNGMNSLHRNNRVNIHTWYATSSHQCRELWLMAVSQHQFFLRKKSHTGSPKSLWDVARGLCRSSASLLSTYSSNDGFSSGISDSVSFYYPFDGESVSSYTMEVAEKDMLSALKMRKKFLDELLVEKRELLNNICMREMEITGEMPNQMPESPSNPGFPFRRKVGTSFEFDDSLLFSKPHEDKEYDCLKRDYTIQKQITVAAHRLAMDPKARKKVRKSRELSYQKALIKLKTMEQQLEYLKKDADKKSNDSLGIVETDSEMLSSKSDESFSCPSTHTRNARYSMHLATPVVTSMNLSRIELSNLTRDFQPKSPSLLRVSESLRTSPRNGTRLRERYMANKIHGSVDQINESSFDDQPFLCGEFENTAVYNVGAMKRDTYESYIRSACRKNFKGGNNFRVTPQQSPLPHIKVSHSIGSQLSQASSTEHSETWSDVVSEETLV